MKSDNTITAFASLGEIMRQAAAGVDTEYTTGLIRLINDHHLTSPWFTPDNVRLALESFGSEMTEENLIEWTSHYPGLFEKRLSKNVAVVMAGNIPMVGFHDFLSVLITGNSIIIKESSKDDKLIRELAGILTTIEPALGEKIFFSEGTLRDFDAVIATGSDNTARHFEFYFGKYPNLIRKHRTGVAFLSGNETEGELKLLGQDVFSYYGLGCRSVTRLFVPEGYNLSGLKKAWHGYSHVAKLNKYVSNYEYQKAVMLINNERFTDFGFLLLKHDLSLFPPVSVVNFEEIKMTDFGNITAPLSDKIQVITGHGQTPFGFAQRPKLWDYSDNIDTIGFLLKNI